MRFKLCHLEYSNYICDIKTNIMRSKPISLSYHCFGKTITLKHDSSVLRVRDLFLMFRSIIVTEFGEQHWKEMLLELGDEEVTIYPE